jgi:hypothetical protein
MSLSILVYIHRYIASIYFVFSTITTVGYGDLTGTQFTCFTSTKVHILTQASAGLTILAQFTCFTSAKVHILTQASSSASLSARFLRSWYSVSMLY